MPHRLTVAADRPNAPRGNAQLFQQPIDRSCVELGEFNRDDRCAIKLAHAPLVPGEECGVDAVETRARHQSDVDFGGRGARGTAHSKRVVSLFFRRSRRAASGSATRLNPGNSVVGIGRAAGKAMVSGLRFWLWMWNS